MRSDGPGLGFRLLRRFGRRIMASYYPDLAVVGAERVPEGPLIIAANHPNSLVDPVVISTVLPRRISWMAKATLFDSGPARAILLGVGAIPVKRRHEGGDKASSAEAIRSAADAVIAGHALGIFPEGLSHDAARLSPLKTGVGRIAVLAARDLAAAGGRATVHVLPVVLHFPDKTRFRSGGLVVVGVPLPVGAGDSAEDVTASVQGGLEDLLVHVDDRDQELLLDEVKLLVRRRYGHEGGHDPREAHRVDREVARAIRRFSRTEPERVRAFATRLRSHLDRLERQGFSLHALEPAHSSPRRTLLATALAPVAAWGLLHSWIPYRIVTEMTRRRTRTTDRTVVATFGLLGGVFVFPLAWLVESVLVAWLAGLGWAALFLVTAPPTALVARWVTHVLRREMGQIVDVLLLGGHPHAVRGLKAERDWLWAEIERWRDIHVHEEEASPALKFVPRRSS